MWRSRGLGPRSRRVFRFAGASIAPARILSPRRSAARASARARSGLRLRSRCHKSAKKIASARIFPCIAAQ